MINDKIGQEIEKLAVSENLFSGAFFIRIFAKIEYMNVTCGGCYVNANIDILTRQHLYPFDKHLGQIYSTWTRSKEFFVN